MLNRRPGHLRYLSFSALDMVGAFSWEEVERVRRDLRVHSAFVLD